MSLFREIYHNYKVEKRRFQDFEKQNSRNRGDVLHYNWWPLDEKKRDSVWMSLLLSTVLNEYPSKKMALVSVFGDRNIIKYVDSDLVLFFTGENVKKNEYVKYADHLLQEPKVDLALGFEYFESKRYMRFPLWLMYAFDPSFEEEKILRRCAQLRCPEIGEKTKFASLIASHDDGLHIRSSMFDALSQIGKVQCPGRFHYNDDTLQNVFGDNKTEYLRQFRFNICPENANTMGYVTEKLFEAIISGCIPVYWGSYNQPEPEILNPEAIIFWNPEGDNSKALQLIGDLYEYPAMMEEFMRQPRLLPSAEDVVCEFFSGLKNRIYNCLEKKQ